MHLDVLVIRANEGTNEVGQVARVDKRAGTLRQIEFLSDAPFRDMRLFVTNFDQGALSMMQKKKPEARRFGIDDTSLTFSHLVLIVLHEGLVRKA